MSPTSSSLLHLTFSLLCRSKIAPRSERNFTLTCFSSFLPLWQVAELKMELKLRSLPVSGTKIDLIERLKAYRENSSIHSAAEKAAENGKSSPPPVSPVASKVSRLALEDKQSADSPSKPSDAAPPPVDENPAQRPPGQEEPPAKQRDSDKDKRLYEKERQIEELMRKLEQEQRLVEELKMQLEVEKRSQQGDSPPHPGLLQVKEEKASTPSSSCSASSSPLRLASAIKQEEADDGCRLSPPNQFIISENLQEVEGGARVLLAASLPVTVPALIQASQNMEASVASQQPCSIQPLTKVRIHSSRYNYYLYYCHYHYDYDSCCCGKLQITTNKSSVAQAH